MSIRLSSLKEKIKTLKTNSNFLDRKVGFLIVTTSKLFNEDYYETPVRIYDDLVVLGVVVKNNFIGKEIARSIDCLVDYIFIDVERKVLNSNSLENNSFDIIKSIAAELNNSEIIPIKANDLTVDAGDIFISNFFIENSVSIVGKTAAIIGAGNIGSKLALKLVERGCNVYIYRRDTKKLKVIVDYINIIRNKYTSAKAKKISDLRHFNKEINILIGSSDENSAINSDLASSLSKLDLVIDIGKGSISKEAIKTFHSKGVEVYRLGVDYALEGTLKSQISARTSMFSKIGRNTINGIKVVSGGLLAKEDEFVVDDFMNPKIIYGVGDGCGEFNHNPNKEMLVSSEILKKIINKVKN